MHYKFLSILDIRRHIEANGERFSTLTLNPSLDKTMILGTPLKTGALNRAKTSTLSAGSKGINVARAMKAMGAYATSYFFAGGETGDILLRLLKNEGILYRTVETKAPTRENIKLIDSVGVCTEVNEEGGPVTTEEISELLSLFYCGCRDSKTSCVFLGGSVPRGVDADIYAEIIENLREIGIPVILDCDGEALKKGIEARPALIKPNAYELSLLTGVDVKNPDVAADICRRIYSETGVSVLCTLGADGAVFIGDGGSYYVNAPKVECVRCFAGAGDAFLSAFILSYARGANEETSLAYAAAFASKKVAASGEMPTQDEVTAYMTHASSHAIQ